MRPVTKFFTAGILFIVLIIAGFIFGLRGCLSKYDERYALPPVLYFEKNGIVTIISLVKFSKTTSYVQEGGMTSKSFDNSYFIQSNNGVTGEKLLSKSIDAHSRLKHYPEEVLGASGNRAWIFLDELMAFDATTLELVADNKSIEAKNRVLKGQLPEESRYYGLNKQNNSIEFTTKNGAKWLLNTSTLIATAKEEEGKENDKEAMEGMQRELMQKLKRLTSTNINFNEMIINQDTVHGKWMGLYAKKEITSLSERVSLTTSYTTDSRRQFFTGTYNNPREETYLINKNDLNNPAAGTYFLDGGFLLDKKTATPIRLQQPGAYLVLCKSEIGQDATLVLSRLSNNGTVQWQLNTELRQWIDWNYTGNRLVILGNSKGSDNSRCNLLLTLNLDSGTVNRYNYFSDNNKQ